MEGADQFEGAQRTAVVFGLANLSGVASQGETGRAGFFRHSLADGGHRRGKDG